MSGTKRDVHRGKSQTVWSHTFMGDGGELKLESSNHTRPIIVIWLAAAAAKRNFFFFSSEQKECISSVGSVGEYLYLHGLGCLLTTGEVVEYTSSCTCFVLIVVTLLRNRTLAGHCQAPARRRASLATRASNGAIAWPACNRVTSAPNPSGTLHESRHTRLQATAHTEHRLW